MMSMQQRKNLCRTLHDTFVQMLSLGGEREVKALGVTYGSCYELVHLVNIGMADPTEAAEERLTAFSKAVSKKFTEVQARYKKEHES